ncbi:SAM-dependent methyltransferase [Microbacterium sp.]|uniref:SAM-dependent methyltransferase n=1 Tax=Microbacterium sp. TaxID=51671 RepID=UPI003F95DE9F
MHSSLFFRPGALLSQPELSSARLDGLLIEVGDGYMPPDLPEDAAARMMSIRHLLAPDCALSGPTAAWVHGAGDSPPLRHHLVRVSTRRGRLQAPPLVVMHEKRLQSGDIETIAGEQITTKLRTLTDLALGAAYDDETAAWLHRFARVESSLVPRATELLRSRQRLPGKRAALAVLDSLGGYEDVTR